MERTEKIIYVSAIAACFAAPEISMAESGTYESVTSLVTNYIKSERGDETIVGGSSSGTTTFTKSSGGAFSEGSSSLFECIIFARRSSSGMDLEAPCTQTDPSGDKLFSLAKRKKGDVTAGTSAEGTSELTGGTGKFAGLTGKCTYKVDYLTGNRLVSIAKCQWQKP